MPRWSRANHRLAARYLGSRTLSYGNCGRVLYDKSPISMSRKKIAVSIQVMILTKEIAGRSNSLLPRCALRSLPYSVDHPLVDQATISQIRTFESGICVLQSQKETTIRRWISDLFDEKEMMLIRWSPDLGDRAGSGWMMSGPHRKPPRVKPGAGAPVS
jgi:hypothetical protein